MTTEDQLSPSPYEYLEFTLYEWRDDRTEEQWNTLLDQLHEKINNVLQKPTDESKMDQKDIERLKHYSELISQNNFRTLTNWESRILNNLNDLLYFEAALNDPNFADAYDSFKVWRQNVEEAENTHNLRSREDAEAAFALDHPNPRDEIIKDEQERRRSILNRKIKERLSIATQKKLQASGVTFLNQQQIELQVRNLLNTVLNQRYSTDILNMLEELKSKSDHSAAIICYLLNGQLQYYPHYELFGKNYNFSKFKDTFEQVFKNWRQRLNLENGEIIQYEDIDMTALEKLTDEINDKYVAIKNEVFQNEEAEKQKLNESQQNQERLAAFAKLTSEEEENIRTQCLEEAKRSKQDPNDTSPFSDYEIKKALENMRNQYINTRLKRLPLSLQERAWYIDDRLNFNPKIVTFVNPINSTLNTDTSRGFGGNMAVDSVTGNITLDFFGLPNYFKEPPELISTEDNSTYKIVEWSPKGTETYKVRTRTEDGEAFLDFICLSVGGSEKVTSVKFGQTVDWESLVRKPVLYVYAPRERKIQLHLQYHGEIIAEYPKRKDNAWNVVAYPDGTVIVDGKQYPYLFWEGIHSNEINWDFSESFCVAGKDSQQFLEMISDKFALNDKEKTDFLTYWLAELQQNPYSLVSFPIKQYEREAVLQIYPQPSQLIRLFMVFKRILKPALTIEPAIPTIIRDVNSYHIVEWGGINLDKR